MAEAILEIVLEKLTSFAGTELGLFLGFDGEKKMLDSMFTAIKATLQDAEEKKFSDKGETIRDWLRKLKDAAYELDDIMDECAYEVMWLENQGVKSSLFDKVQGSCLSSFQPKYVAFRYKIAKRMKRISDRLDQIAKEREQLHLIGMIQEGSGLTELRQTTSFITEPQVYGREEDTKRIVDSLIGDADASRLSVYPILGQGGLGKTTLAQLIFNHEMVVNHFELRIWVCVSEDFGLKRMTKAIIEAVSGHASEDLDLEVLQRRLQELLQSKRYLLVLDDVWDDEQENWQRLKSVLACGVKGASILVTTRLSKVATIMGTTTPYELSILSNNDCWEVFKHRAFAPNEAEQVELVVTGKEIVKKCGGVPLAANALGGILRFERKKEAWLNVKESNLWSLTHNVMSALRLSYLNLPVKLRQCFAYCAIFPQDKRIRKQDLIELWMANGFISSNGMLDAENVGDRVWNELYWRSFFQDVETDEFGKVTSFKMHDLVHDLAQSVAEEVCCIMKDNDVSTLSERIHHLSAHKLTTTGIQLHKIKSLRTCISSNRDSNYGVLVSSHVLKCYSLRVLEFGRRKKLSSSIGDLKHLRYLNLSCGQFKTLPKSLCKLLNLQILKLDYCRSLQKLPKSLMCLKALQQLSLNGCSSLSSLPPNIGNLTSLTILTMYVVGSKRGFHLAELGPLKIKGNLDIQHLEKVKSVVDAKEANMSSKQLNRLWLSWDTFKESEIQENVEEIMEMLQPDTLHLESLKVEGYKGVHFPQWMSSPSLKYLKYLMLHDCPSCLQLPALGKLPSLKDLRIYRMTNVKYLYEEACDDGVVFVALEFLSLYFLKNLIRLTRENGENMFPRLSTVHISGCWKLLAEEALLQGLYSLKKLDIRDFEKFYVSTGFKCLTCLEELSISSCIEVEGLHEALQHMTALKMLSLYHLPNLESLPDCFENLPLLHYLYIEDCENLRCLPTSLSLSRLKKLGINSCPELEKRCEKDTGEDWPKIAHIPDICVIPTYYDSE